jgi:hypothetical protein
MLSPDFDDPERSYRRGYTHGAWDVIQAVRGLVSPGELAKLEAWFNGPARKWRMDAYAGKSRRGADGAITGDIVPPRHLLRLG